MRLKLSEWAERTYTDASRPAMPTLRKMADDGEIAGAFKTKSGRWFVDVGPSSISTDELVRRAVGNDPDMLKVMGL